jgi:hypothetical protein
VNRRRKIVVGVSACVFIVSFLLLAAILVAPKVINSEVVKAKIRNEIKKAAGVEIDFEHLGIDFFPHPHVIVGQVELSMPPVVRGKAVSVTVQPKILPLFLGKMQIAGLHLDSAELDYTLPEKPRHNPSHIIIWQKGFSPSSQVCRNSKYRTSIFRLTTATRICSSASGKFWNLRRLIPIWKARSQSGKSPSIVNLISGKVSPWTACWMQELLKAAVGFN